MIELLAMQNDTKAFKVAEYLSNQQRNIYEATNIVFLVKNKQTASDSDSILYKSLSNSGITIDEAHVYVHFTPDDYGTGKLIGNKKYVYGLGFEFPDLDVLLEPKITNIDGKLANFITVLPNFVNN